MQAPVIAMHAPIIGYVFGDFEVALPLHELRFRQRAVRLSRRAFDVLVVLLEGRGRLVRKEELLEAVWRGRIVHENNLAVQIGAVRKVIGEDAIATVSGRGYQFVAPVACLGSPIVSRAGQQSQPLGS